MISKGRVKFKENVRFHSWSVWEGAEHFAFIQGQVNNVLVHSWSSPVNCVSCKLQILTMNLILIVTIYVLNVKKDHKSLFLYDFTY